MYAVIRTGGKQYKVAPQDVLQIEKVEGAAGDPVRFNDVLMVGGEGEPILGAPLVADAVVSAEVVEQGRGPKVIIFKKKRRQNYRRKKGHRQDLTTVRILEILTDGKKPSDQIKTIASASETGEKPSKQTQPAGVAAENDPTVDAPEASAVASSKAKAVAKPRAPKKPTEAE